MKTSNAFLRPVYFLTGLLLTLLLVTSSVKAQCPSDDAIHPFSYEFGFSHWTADTTEVDYGNCQYFVYYCHRVVHYMTDSFGIQPYYQTFTYGIDSLADSTHPCNPDSSDQNIIDYIADDMLTKVPPNFYPPCNDNYQKMKGAAFRPNCWRKVDNHSYRGCSDTSNYCEMICDICMDGNVYKFGCSFQVLGTPTCSVLVPWKKGDCSLVECGINPH